MQRHRLVRTRAATQCGKFWIPDLTEASSKHDLSDHCAAPGAQRELTGTNILHVHRLRRRHRRVLVVRRAALSSTDAIVGLILLDLLAEAPQPLFQCLLLRKKAVATGQTLRRLGEEALGFVGACGMLACA